MPILPRSCSRLRMTGGSKLLFAISSIFFGLLLLCSVPVDCSAQNKATLLTGSAAQKADERMRSKRLSSSFNGSFSTHNLRLDTVDGILLESKTDSEFFSDFRGLKYLRYVSNVVDFEQVDEIEQDSFARKLFFYQLGKSAVSHIEKTPLERHYRRMLDYAKQLRNYTTFSLVKAVDGDLGVARGEEESEEEAPQTKSDSAPGKRLLEFKLHASARNGIEPRIRFNENLNLRMDPLNGDVLLEFRQNF